MEKVSGIYCIENIVNSKKYIGKSTNIYKRWNQHKTYLRNNREGLENRHLCHAWQKYGEENFKFYILEKCDEDQLNEKEKYWINEYNTTNELFGYNKTEGGTGGNTIIGYSEKQLMDYKAKKRILHKNTNLKGEDTYHAKLTNKDVLNIIKRFQAGECDTDIADNYGLSKQIINDIRLRKTWTSITDSYDWPPSNGRVYSQKKSNCYVAVDMYTKDGQYIKTYDNARIAELELGIGYKLISAVIHGDKNSAGGYIWRKQGHSFDEFEIKKHEKPVDKYDMNWNFICSYNSEKEALQDNNISSLYSCLSGKTKSAGGYRWLYKGTTPPIIK